MSYKCVQGHFTDKEHENKNCPYDSKDKINELHKKVELTQEKNKETENVIATEEDINALYGKEFKGYKGQEAINKLLQEKQGHVKGAFHRDDFGDIDLIWGNEYNGLKHIITQREKQNIDIKSFLCDIAEVIEKGEYKGKNSNNTFEIWHKGKMAIISPEYHGYQITFLLTAFKRQKNKGSKTATL